jgi:hypothetical protein
VSDECSPQPWKTSLTNKIMLVLSAPCSSFNTGRNLRRILSRCSNDTGLGNLARSRAVWTSRLRGGTTTEHERGISSRQHEKRLTLVPFADSPVRSLQRVECSALVVDVVSPSSGHALRSGLTPTIALSPHHCLLPRLLPSPGGILAPFVLPHVKATGITVSRV